MKEVEKQVMGLISSAGASRSLAFEALAKVKSKDYDGARDLIKKAKEADVEAHNIQTKLIQKELNADTENKDEMSLLMVHAQDHYMTAQLARDLIEEFIEIFESREA